MKYVVSGVWIEVDASGAPVNSPRFIPQTQVECIW
jgi:hypothetical protein